MIVGMQRRGDAKSVIVALSTTMTAPSPVVLPSKKAPLHAFTYVTEDENYSMANTGCGTQKLMTRVSKLGILVMYIRFLLPYT